MKLKPEQELELIKVPMYIEALSPEELAEWVSSLMEQNWMLTDMVGQLLMEDFGHGGDETDSVVFSILAN